MKRRLSPVDGHKIPAYVLEITDQDIKTIKFVGHRYSWSDILLDYIVVNCFEHLQIEMTEAEAHDWKQAIEEEDSLFTLLDNQSELYSNLVKLWQSIV